MTTAFDNALTALTGIHRVSILGAERSGIAAARMLIKLEKQVFVSDRATGERAEQLHSTLSELGVEFELGVHSDRLFEGVDVLVTSPGVDQRNPLFATARERGIKIWSELELASRIFPGRMIAITGTNGKSTTTAWLGDLLQVSGYETVVCGNIGTAFSDVVLNTTDATIAVVEVSSFQLEFIEQFCPDVAIMLNLSPDHLDRYNTVTDYYRSKRGIGLNQTVAQTLICNTDDAQISKHFADLSGSRFDFALSHPLERGVWLGNDCFLLRDTEESVTRLTAYSELQLPGRHNLANACAVIAGAYRIGLSVDEITRHLPHFAGLPHRLQRVPTIDGIQWINDSKATTPDSARVALLAYDRPVIWLAGGYDKGVDFSGIKQLVKSKVKHLFAFGKAADKVATTFDGVVTISRFQSLREAVQAARHIAFNGDVVLLSPMCASFDEFKNYEDRGERFTDYVKEISQ